MRLRYLLASTVVYLTLAGGAAVSTTAEPGRPTATVTKAQAMAFAKAVNLQTSDLPGAEALPEGVERSHRDPAGRELQCGKRSRRAGRSLFDETSVLVDPAGFLLSAVVVMRTEALAEALATRLASRRGRRCLARLLGEAERVEDEKTVTSHAVKVRWVSLAGTLGVGAIGVHILAELPPLELPPALRHRPKRRLPKPKASFSHIDAVFFRVGPAEIVLFRFGVKPFPPATELQALSVLHSRAEEHRL
jgi:hypothetical protein